MNSKYRQPKETQKFIVPNKSSALFMLKLVNAREKIKNSSYVFYVI